MRSTIICVDDDRWLIEVLAGLLDEWLGKNYAIEKAMSAMEALDIIDDCLEEGVEVSLVIADYIMPGMKGDELLEQVKLKTPMTRRIMLTGFAAIDGIKNAINKAGIYRFLSKPWDNKDMMLTVLQAIRSYEQDKQTEKLAQSHKDLYFKSQELVKTLQANYLHVTTALSEAVELREGTPQSNHAPRVAGYSERLAKAMQLDEKDVKNIKIAALLHDVGKLGLTDSELNDLSGSGCYTKKEVAKRQAEHAKVILRQMDIMVINSVIYHTERADGLGPYGLKGASIPIGAKIIGICNYLDILRCVRPDDSVLDVLRFMLPDKDKIIEAGLLNVLIGISQ